jgi:nucleotidyltransferase substrate binding protein (TIGR01987 family)
MSTDIPLLTDFEKAVARLKEVLDLKKTDVIRDSAIKRFELCFDLAWKCIQAYARREGLDCQSPRACLKTAFQLGLIDYEDDWLKMLDDRNLSVHTYKEKNAEDIYGRLSKYIGLLDNLAKNLSEKRN